MRCILTQCPTFLHNVLHFDVSLAHWFDNIILYHNDGIFEYTTGTTFQKLIKGCKIFCNALTHLTNRYCLLQKLCFIPCYICVTWIKHCIASKCMTTWQIVNYICATMTMWYCSAYLNFSEHDTGAIDRPQGGALWGTGGHGITLVSFSSLVPVLSDIIKEYGIPVEQYHGTGGRPISYHGGSCDYRSSKRSQPV